MPTSEPRRQPTQARSRHTVEKILHATGRLLIHSSYGEITTKQIASEAGVSIGSFYQFFGNKVSVVAALIDSMETEIGALVNDVSDVDALRREGISDAWIEAIIEAFRRRNVEFPGFTGVWGGQFTDPLLVRRSARLRRRTTEAIRDVLLAAFPDACTGATDAAVTVVVETARSVLRTIGRAGEDSDFDANRLRTELPHMLASYLRSRLGIRAAGSGSGKRAAGTQLAAG